MKRYQITIEMEDGLPEYSVLMFALGGLVQRIPDLRRQKSMSFKSWGDHGYVMVRLRTSRPKPGQPKYDENAEDMNFSATVARGSTA